MRALICGISSFQCASPHRTPKAVTETSQTLQTVSQHLGHSLLRGWTCRTSRDSQGTDRASTSLQAVASPSPPQSECSGVSSTLPGGFAIVEMSLQSGVLGHPPSGIPGVWLPGTSPCAWGLVTWDVPLCRAKCHFSSRRRTLSIKGQREQADSCPSVLSSDNAPPPSRHLTRRIRREF